MESSIKYKFPNKESLYSEIPGVQQRIIIIPSASSIADQLSVSISSLKSFILGALEDDSSPGKALRYQLQNPIM